MKKRDAQSWVGLGLSWMVAVVRREKAALRGHLIWANARHSVVLRPESVGRIDRTRLVVKWRVASCSLIATDQHRNARQETPRHCTTTHQRPATNGRARGSQCHRTGKLCRTQKQNRHSSGSTGGLCQRPWDWSLRSSLSDQTQAPTVLSNRGYGRVDGGNLCHFERLRTPASRIFKVRDPRQKRGVPADRSASAAKS